jgi:hypothetical protein
MLPFGNDGILPKKNEVNGQKGTNATGCKCEKPWPESGIGKKQIRNRRSTHPLRTTILPPPKKIPRATRIVTDGPTAGPDSGASMRSLWLSLFFQLCFGKICTLGFVLSPEYWSSCLAVQIDRGPIMGPISVNTVFATTVSKKFWKQKRKEPLLRLQMSNVQGIANQVNLRSQFTSLLSHILRKYFHSRTILQILSSLPAHPCRIDRMELSSASCTVLWTTGDANPTTENSTGSC